MMTDGTLVFWVVTLAAFGAIALLTLLVGNVIASRNAVARRLTTAPGRGGAAIGSASDLPVRPLLPPKLAARLVNEASGTTSALRRQLVLSGYFSPDAAAVYSLARFCGAIVPPIISYVFILERAPASPAIAKFALMAVSLLVGYFGPEAWIKRRQRRLQEEYRLIFPDFLDLLVVAIDAGLSIESAIERITTEMRNMHRELAVNLVIMSGEMRAGRSTIDALYGLSERLGIEEARSFVVLLRQSLELGSNVVDALKVYSEEMRDKRMSRAEERAMALPVKMVLPLGLFIFPTILMMILSPVLIKLTGVFAAVGH